MSIKSKTLFKKTSKTQNDFLKLLDSKCASFIISVNIKSSLEEVNEDLDAYIRIHPVDETLSTQKGRVWILAGKKKKTGELVSLSVGQSQDIIGEIRRAIGNALIKKDNDYYKYMKKYFAIAFFEIDVDAYIGKHLKMKKEDLKELSYELSKDYLAEYLVAKNTASEDWYYGTTLDKRFYFHFENK